MTDDDPKCTAKPGVCANLCANFRSSGNHKARKAPAFIREVANSEEIRGYGSRPFENGVAGIATPLLGTLKNSRIFAVAIQPMDSEVKTCRWCCQEIPKPARRCPYCTTMQGFWATGFFAFIPTLVFMLLIGWFYFSIFRSSPNYADQVSIADSKMVFGKHDGNSTVSVIGMLKNNSEVALDDLHLEAQFFDKNGELLDVGSHDGYGETIPASGEAAFKVYVYAARPEEDYGSFKVHVRSAKDARAFP